MKKLVLLVLTSLLSVSFCMGQQKINPDSIAKNSIYASFGGAGIFYAVNYERNLYLSETFSLAARIGLGTSFSSVLFPSEFNMPIGASALYGKKNNHFELGFFISNYLIEQYDHMNDRSYKELKNLMVPTLGYRYQKHHGGLIIKAGLSAIMNINSTTNTYSPWIDLGVGWAF